MHRQDFVCELKLCCTLYAHHPPRCLTLAWITFVSMWQKINKYIFKEKGLPPVYFELSTPSGEFLLSRWAVKPQCSLLKYTQESSHTAQERQLFSHITLEDANILINLASETISPKKKDFFFLYLVLILGKFSHKHHQRQQGWVITNHSPMCIISHLIGIIVDVCNVIRLMKQIDLAIIDDHTINEAVKQ